MAIGIEMAGYCKNCPEAELELEEVYRESFDITSNVLWNIHCKHEAACERIFKGRFKNDEDDLK